MATYLSFRRNCIYCKSGKQKKRLFLRPNFSILCLWFKCFCLIHKVFNKRSFVACLRFVLSIFATIRWAFYFIVLDFGPIIWGDLPAPYWKLKNITRDHGEASSAPTPPKAIKVKREKERKKKRNYSKVKSPVALGHWVSQELHFFGHINFFLFVHSIFHVLLMETSCSLFAGQMIMMESHNWEHSLKAVDWTVGS